MELDLNIGWPFSSNMPILLVFGEWIYMHENAISRLSIARNIILIVTWRGPVFIGNKSSLSSIYDDMDDVFCEDEFLMKFL